MALQLSILHLLLHVLEPFPLFGTLSALLLGAQVILPGGVHRPISILTAFVAFLTLSAFLVRAQSLQNFALHMFPLLLDVGGRDGVVALVVLVAQCFLLCRAESCGCRGALPLVEGIGVVRDIVSRRAHGCLNLARGARRIHDLVVLLVAALLLRRDLVLVGKLNIVALVLGCDVSIVAAYGILLVSLGLHLPFSLHIKPLLA